MVLDALKQLTEKFPQKGCRHHITFNDETQSIELGLWICNELKNFAIFEEELSDPKKLISDIAALLGGNYD